MSKSCIYNATFHLGVHFFSEIPIRSAETLIPVILEQSALYISPPENTKSTGMNHFAGRNDGKCLPGHFLLWGMEGVIWH